jgi:hypothetical protein
MLKVHVVCKPELGHNRPEPRSGEVEARSLKLQKGRRRHNQRRAGVKNRSI